MQHLFKRFVPALQAHEQRTRKLTDILRSTFMVSEQKKGKRNKKAKQNQWHNNDNINKRQNTLKKATVYLLEGFLVKMWRIIKSAVFRSSLPMLGTKTRTLLLEVPYIVFPKDNNNIKYSEGYSLIYYIRLTLY